MTLIRASWPPLLLQYQLLVDCMLRLTSNTYAPYLQSHVVVVWTKHARYLLCGAVHSCLENWYATLVQIGHAAEVPTRTLIRRVNPAGAGSAGAERKPTHLMRL